MENRLVKQVSDTFLKLRSKASALLSTLQQRVQNALVRNPESNLSHSQKTLLEKLQSSDKK